MNPFGQISDAEAAELEQAAKEALQSDAPVRGEIADWVRHTRSREQWERYDTIVVAQGANARDDGWFNTWADFAQASQIEWFKGRSSSVGESYTNQSRERTDFAQDFYQLGIEFIAPVGSADLQSDQLDAQFFPLFFTQELPQAMMFEIQVAQSDTILKIPGSHAPGGVGPAGMVLDQSTGPTVIPGTNGQAFISNVWKWPEPILIPAKGSISVKATIDNPAKTFLTNYTACPGVKNVPMCPPDPNGATIALPMEYKIRVTNRGPRYLQLRGARSA